MASNLTITVDDEALRRARIRAVTQGTSVNAVLRDFLHAYAGMEDEHEAALAEVLRLSEQSQAGRGGTSWSREELYERSSNRP